MATYFAAPHYVCYWHKVDIATLSAFGGKADIGLTPRNVSFWPTSDIRWHEVDCLRRQQIPVKLKRQLT